MLERAEAERGRLDAVLQQLPAGVVIADAATGGILHSNRQVEEILRRPLPPAPLRSAAGPKLHPRGSARVRPRVTRSPSSLSAGFAPPLRRTGSPWPPPGRHRGPGAAASALAPWGAADPASAGAKAPPAVSNGIDCAERHRGRGKLQLERVARRSHREDAELQTRRPVFDVTQRREPEEDAQVATGGREHRAQLIDPGHHPPPPSTTRRAGVSYDAWLFLVKPPRV